MTASNFGPIVCIKLDGRYTPDNGHPERLWYPPSPADKCHQLFFDLFCDSGPSPKLM
jgi:hypothetical protein